MEILFQTGGSGVLAGFYPCSAPQARHLVHREEFLPNQTSVCLPLPLPLFQPEFWGRGIGVSGISIIVVFSFRGADSFAVSGFLGSCNEDEDGVGFCFKNSSFDFGTCLAAPEQLPIPCSSSQLRAIPQLAPVSMVTGLSALTLRKHYIATRVL